MINSVNEDKGKKWHVVYVRSRSEKKAAKELEDLHVETFLPLQRKLSQWKDRKKWVETPLLPGYCFVKITNAEYYKVLQIVYIVKYITFEGKAATIPDDQINTNFTVEVPVAHLLPV